MATFLVKKRKDHFLCFLCLNLKHLNSVPKFDFYLVLYADNFFVGNACVHFRAYSDNG